MQLGRRTERSRKCYWRVSGRLCTKRPRNKPNPVQETIMKIWNKPQVREQAVGMEVTAYLPADIDLI